MFCLKPPLFWQFSISFIEEKLVWHHCIWKPFLTKYALCFGGSEPGRGCQVQNENKTGAFDDAGQSSELFWLFTIQ
jgi:hypothetical protein